LDFYFESIQKQKKAFFRNILGSTATNDALAEETDGCETESARGKLILVIAEKVFKSSAVFPQDLLEVVTLLAVAFLQPLHLFETSVNLMFCWLSFELVLEAIMMVFGDILLRVMANVVPDRLEVFLHFGARDLLVRDLFMAMNGFGELLRDLGTGHHLGACEMIFHSAVLFHAIFHDHNKGLDLIVEVDGGEFDVLGEDKREFMVLLDVRRLEMETILDGGRPDNNVVTHH